MVSKHARAPAGGFTRLMIEKPFGHDAESFAALHETTTRFFDEHEVRALARSASRSYN